jgi:hypothetical protein
MHGLISNGRLTRIVGEALVATNTSRVFLMAKPSLRPMLRELFEADPLIAAAAVSVRAQTL